MGDGKDSPFPGQDIGDLVALPCPIVGAGIFRQQVRQKLLGIDPEEDPVNGLKLQGVVVEVDQLHQGVTGRGGFGAPPRTEWA